MCTFQALTLWQCKNAFKWLNPNVLTFPFQTSTHSHCSVIVAISDCWTLICRKPQAAVNTMTLSTVWPRLAPNQTSPVPTLHNPCLLGCLTHLPVTSSSVFQATDGAQSVHRVSRSLAYSQEVVLEGEKLSERSGWKEKETTCRAGQTKYFFFFFFSNDMDLGCK